MSSRYEFNVTQASVSKQLYYMPSTFYIVKLPLALGTIIFSIELKPYWHSHMTMTKPYWGINMDFWHSLIVIWRKGIVYLFDFYSFQHGWVDLRIVMRPWYPMYFTLDSGHKTAKCQKKKMMGYQNMEQLGFLSVSIKQTKMTSSGPGVGIVHGCQGDLIIDRYPRSF